MDDKDIQMSIKLYSTEFVSFYLKLNQIIETDEFNLLMIFYVENISQKHNYICSLLYKIYEISKSFYQIICFKICITSLVFYNNKYLCT